MVSVACDTAGVAATVAGLGKRLGAEVLQEHAALPNDAVLVVRVIWPGHSDRTATETLEAVAEFLRQCP